MVSSTSETQVVSVSLHLDREEAQFLADLLSRVGGSNSTRRRLAIAIADELKEHGISHDTSPFRTENDWSGTISDMKDYVFMKRV